MSGGVDSSVAAFLIKQQGFDCIGVTMKLFSNEDIGISWKKRCCSMRDVDDASNAAISIGIPFCVNDFTPDFKRQVIDRFVDTYQNGGTPNPCIDCNRYIKFTKLYQRAKLLDIDYIVTGHYARIEKDNESARYFLKKALDEAKDQSYVLYSLTQEQLAHTIFPLGKLNKSEVRKIAKTNGFINAEKQDSQDICFVPNGDYAEFIKHYTNKTYEKGDFIDLQGNILGQHDGIIRYTIGQRKGLRISLNKPMYVHSKDIINNTVTLCEDNDLFRKSLEITDLNWIAIENIDKPLRVKAKIRYNQTAEWATATKTDSDKVLLEFDEPQRAIAKGQAAVLYNDDIVVGGGTIF